MSSIDVNKYAGAVLAALLLAVGLGVFIDMLYEPGHGGHAAPVFLVGVEAAVDHGAGAGEESAVEAAPVEVVAVLPIGARLAEADVAAGEKAAKKCAACHTFDNGGLAKIGPNLWNVVGAAKAGKADFSYSSVLAGLGGAWTYEDLDAFLEKPKTFAKGTKMAFPGIKSGGQRADVIAYLRAQSDSPASLPDN